MRERPILMSAPMVNAILQNRKTQTRRIMNPQPQHLQYHEYKGKVIYEGEHRMWCWKDLVLENIWDFPNNANRQLLASRNRYGVAGNQLYVKETFATYQESTEIESILTNQAWDRFSESKTDIVSAAMEIPKSTGAPKVLYRADFDDERDVDWNWKPSIFMPRDLSRLKLKIKDARVERLQDISVDDCIAEGITARDVMLWSLETADKEKVEGLCWIETPKQSSDEDYCRDCADKKLVEVIAERGGDGTDCFVDGGWPGHEADGPRFCETCGVTLEVSYTDYAVEQELEHFESYNAGPIGDYEVNRLASCICGEDQERRFAKIGYRWLWQSINGKDSWGANPFVYVLDFEDISN